MKNIENKKISLGGLTIYFGFASAIIVCFLLIHLAEPAKVEFIKFGLDPSWKSVSALAHENGWVFGQDLLFTSGPLSPVYTHLYFGDLQFVSVILNLALAVYIGVALGVCSKWNPIALSVLAVGLLFLDPWPDATRDAIRLAMPLFFMLIFVSGYHGFLITLISLVIAGTIALSKFSSFPLIVLATLFADIIMIEKRSPPVNTLSFFAVLAGLYVVMGAPLAAFPDFILGGLDVSSGYSDAMSVTGSSSEILWWILLASIAGILIAVASFLQLKSGDQPVLSAMLLPIYFSAALWLFMKSGFVRHDGHALISWKVLAISTLAVAACWSGKNWRRYRVFSLGLFLVGIASISGLYIRQGQTVSVGVAKASMEGTISTVRNLLSIAENPGAWQASLKNEQKKAVEETRLQLPFPALSGKVDMVGWYQSSVIANKLDYSPRPSFQEYGTYTSGLIVRNKAYYESRSAPDYVIFTPRGLDGRMPALTEAALWPDFLRSYTPIERVGEFVVLEQLDEPRETLLGPYEETAAELGHWVDLPEGNEPVYAKVNLEKTLLGRGFGFLYKLPPVYIELEYDGGYIARYRLIPDIAASGFLVSPVVNNSADYLRLASGRADLFPSRPTRFRVFSEYGNNYLYRHLIKIDIARIDLVPLTTTDKEMSLVYHMLDPNGNVINLLKNNTIDNQRKAIIAEGLLAHAPTDYKLDGGTGEREVQLGFGIIDGAWQNDNKTDGVCFSMVANNSSKVLWMRCLHPRKDARDRGVQFANVNLPLDQDGDIRLVTECGPTCSWDWSYWSKAKVVNK